MESDTPTYNGYERDGATIAFGGYSTNFVVDEDFAVHVADTLDLAGVAPLLCAGITLYSPLRHWGARAGVEVGIIGLGGLGHMGVKFAAALGATTTVFSHSADKETDARRLGAHDFVVTSDPGALARQRERFDLIINTVSADLDLAPYLELLKVDGNVVLVGLPVRPYEVNAMTLVNKRRSVAGSMAEGMKELQEMMDFCAEHSLTSDVEIVTADYIQQAFERTIASDVKYRFVDRRRHVLSHDVSQSPRKTRDSIRAFVRSRAPGPRIHRAMWRAETNSSPRPRLPKVAEGSLRKRPS